VAGAGMPGNSSVRCGAEMAAGTRGALPARVGAPIRPLERPRNAARPPVMNAVCVFLPSCTSIENHRSHGLEPHPAVLGPQRLVAGQCHRPWAQLASRLGVSSVRMFSPTRRAASQTAGRHSSRVAGGPTAQLSCCSCSSARRT
jgi:hypothetical protein